eukprot:scaffold9426_cov90-Isochrysis_galbana.AAC.6
MGKNIMRLWAAWRYADDVPTPKPHSRLHARIPPCIPPAPGSAYAPLTFSSVSGSRKEKCGSLVGASPPGACRGVRSSMVPVSLRRPTASQAEESMLRGDCWREARRWRSEGEKAGVTPRAKEDASPNQSEPPGIPPGGRVQGALTCQFVVVGCLSARHPSSRDPGVGGVAGEGRVRRVLEPALTQAGAACLRQGRRPLAGLRGCAKGGGRRAEGRG